MSKAIRRTLVATGCTSGLGLAALSHLLATSSTTYRIILGARSENTAHAAVAHLLSIPRPVDSFSDHTHSTSLPLPKHEIIWKPLQLQELDSVRDFANAVGQWLGKQAEQQDDGAIDIVLLNAGIYKPLFEPTDLDGWGAEGCRLRPMSSSNYIAQHYLLQMLEKYLRPCPNSARPRVIFVSSSKHSSVKSVGFHFYYRGLDELTPILRGEIVQEGMVRYSASKFVQMLAAHGWRSRLRDKAYVIAVSPGFVPSSGLSRESPFLGRLFMSYVLPWAPFTTTLSNGGKAISRCITVPDEIVDELELKAAKLAHGGDDRKGENKTELVYMGVMGDLMSPDERVRGESGLKLQRKWMPSLDTMDGWQISHEID